MPDFLRGAPRHFWEVRAIAAFTALAGALNVFTAVLPALVERLALLEPVFPLEIRHGARLATAVAGFVQLSLAGQLWRRKRVAWLITLVVFGASALLNLTKDLDYEAALVSAILALSLWLLRRNYWAQSDPPSFRQGLWFVSGALAFTLVYGAAGFYLLDRHFSVSFDLGGAIGQTVLMFTQFSDPGVLPLTGFGRYFADSIYAVSIATLALALAVLARPVLIRQPATADERRRARALVAAHGRTNLARLTLLDDKAYFFSQGGSLVAFVVKDRIALALGDPIGPTTDVDATLDEFKRHCGRNDWEPAWYQTLPEYLDRYRAAGFDVLKIGQEALVDLERFSLEGRAGKEFRTTLKKLDRLGHRWAISQPPLADNFLSELHEVSAEWLTLQHGRELHFGTGWFDEAYLRDSPVLSVRDPSGALSAFINLVPLYSTSGVGVDLMRRRRAAAAGTMDFLFVQALKWASDQRYKVFSLGLSALAGIGQQQTDPALERALHFLYEHLNRYYGFKGLHGFKDKFRPHWEPRYLVYPGPTSLPAVTAALIRADLGDDFWRGYLAPHARNIRSRDG